MAHIRAAENPAMRTPFPVLLACGLVSLHLSTSRAGEPQVESTARPAETVRAKPPETFLPVTAANRRVLAEIVQEAFAATHDGWSADEVILNDTLNTQFIQHCHNRLPDACATHCNWALMNLRKAGKLKTKATKRRNDRHDEYLHAAEIAARFLHDKHELTIDRVLCSAEYRREFDGVAQSVAPGVSAYLLRKAALGLRKARRLRPELVLRVADWGKQVLTLPAAQIVKNPDVVPDQPGIYVFRDPTGYLYVGESSSLRIRVAKHLDHSDRKSLAHYLWQTGVGQITVELHAFDPDSKAREKTARRAYESELIRSRKPRFNIAP